MLADFRFVLGAILAVTMLAVAGLGVVMSVTLIREAHIAPLEDSRSLAYAGPVTWNEFYDPDAARRFEGGGRSGIEPAAVPARSLGADPLAEIVEDKEHAAEAPDTPTAVAAPVAEGPATPPAAERSASAPATPVPSAEPAPLVAELPPAAAPPAELIPQPRPTPPFQRRARPHVRRAFVARPQTPLYLPFGWLWPSFGSQLGTHYSTQYGVPSGTTTASRNQLSGAFSNRSR